jgi:hypothetical protein
MVSSIALEAAYKVWVYLVIILFLFVDYRSQLAGKPTHTCVCEDILCRGRFDGPN